jgi:PadR family transcriptional regulator, regulatory protein PadR
MRDMDTQALGKRVNELLVLASLRDGPRHGYQIALDVEARSGGEFELQHGTLYPILHRLEREGRIVGRWTRGPGRRRKEYELKEAGRRHLGEEAGRFRGAMERLFAMVGEGDDGAIRASPAAG